MVWSSTLLPTINKNYKSEAQPKDKFVAEPSNPLNIEKLVEPIPKIPKGLFKTTFHNSNARDASNYFAVEYLAQTPYVMLALEVLQSFPSQRYYREKFLWLGVPQQIARLQKSIFPNMQ